MTTTNRDKFFDAVNEAYDALLAAIRATEERGHHVSQAVLEEAEKGERELVALGRKWADAPTSVFENLDSIVDVQARAQRRALELTRDLVGGAGDYGSEVQEALRRLIKANSALGEVTVEAVRHGYERVRGTAEEGRQRARRRVRMTRVPAGAAAAGAEEAGAEQEAV